MSRYYGGGFAEFVEDSLAPHVTAVEVAAVKRALAHKREAIEWALADYDEDAYSWRQYRNDMWSNYVSDDPVTREMVAFALANPTMPAWLVRDDSLTRWLLRYFDDSPGWLDGYREASRLDVTRRERGIPHAFFVDTAPSRCCRTCAEASRQGATR